MRALLLALAATLTLGAAPAPDPVVVIGAGLAGLTTAYRLQQAGLPVLVLEATGHVGGRVRSASYPDLGLAAEAGLQAYWSTNPAVGLIRELKLPLTEPGTAYCSLMFGRELLPFVEDTDAAFIHKILGPEALPGFKAWDQGMIALYERSQQRPLPADLAALQHVSFADWLAKDRRLTPRARRMVQTIEFATVADRISVLEGVLEWHLYAGDGARCFQIPGGNQRLPEELARRVPVRLGQQVTRIVQHEGDVEVTAQDQSTYATRRFKARRVVSTVPLFKLSDIQLEPPLPAEVRRGIATQGYGSYFTTQVVLDPAARRFWQFAGDDATPILTGGPLALIYSVATKDAALLTIIAKGETAQHLNDPAMTADQLKHELGSHLEALWPGVTPFVRSMSFVKYQPRAIASWPVGRSRLDGLSDAVRRPLGRLYLAGDFTEGTHSDGASWSAVRVVRQVCAAEHVQPPPGLVPAGLAVPTQDAR